ncbi:m7GpppN-mRNA hydrolase [Chelonus insularis]|uniref:m7GpppN-mRNA hydrolase n=1 Tax=Chelonus insularis TaxID=460826 RepID=UPI00158AD655|nr:m7GpppN-mRNA hydrolase [Chelonus insularis]
MTEHAIPFDILDDLSSRFIINVPEEERKDLVRICFQIELAHWFYLDFYCANEVSKLRSCTMDEFAMHIFQHIPFLKSHVQRLDSVLEQWREYKQNVPTFGAIVLNEDMSKVLLVQNYWSKNSWGFPKGKVNEDEDPSHCAVREVLEETGFDISGLIDKNEYIESIINDRLVRLYIICGVQKDTKFQPQTRKEIKNVEWFSLSDLPNTARDMTPKVKMGVGPNAFFMVVPFVKRMKRWVQEKLQRDKQSSGKKHRRKSLGDVDLSSKNKRQQPLQGFGTFEGKRGLSNTSPIRNRRQLDNKSSFKGSNSDKSLIKVPIKRNLFGEPTDDKITKSPSTLAKKLSESPHTSIPIKTVKVSKHPVNGDTFPEIYSAFTLLTPRKSNSEMSEFDYRSPFWLEFKFDKPVIMNCLEKSKLFQ